MLMVYKVVEYLEGRPKHSLGVDMDKHNKQKAALAPLLLVSERWRGAALESLCDNCALDLDHSHESRKVAFPAWPADSQLAWLCKTNLVKWVSISTTLERAVADKVANEAMLQLQRHDVVAPSARKMILCLRKSNVQAPSTGNNAFFASAPASTNGLLSVMLLAHYLLRIAPSVVSIVVSIPSVDAAQSGLVQLYDPLLTALCRCGVKALKVYSEQGTIPISLRLQGVSGLTSITNGVNIVAAPFAQLIYRNASTLQTIGYRFVSENSWRSMIYGLTKTPAVFACLTTLTLAVVGIPFDATWAAISNVTPFPILSTLNVSGKHPFNDDLLFRDNGRTLQSLCLPASAIARNTLARFNVLRRSGVSRINLIHVGSFKGSDTVLLSERADAAIRQQVPHILETATKFVIARDINDAAGTKIYNAITASSCTPVLRYLDFGSFATFFAGDVISLLTPLPSLVILSCCLGDGGLAAMVSPNSAYPNNLRLAYYPLSTNFRLLRVKETTDASASITANISMLVAIACPNFAHVDIPPELRNSFSREIAWSAHTRPFKPYADSIRRLIYEE